MPKIELIQGDCLEERYTEWLETKLQNTPSNSDYAAALKVVEEYKSSTPETVRSCIGVECFAKQRLNQSKN
jgi:hypothetical protein